jgi:LysR family transcriptional regulator, nitrogen assimilation regulatory protein
MDLRQLHYFLAVAETLSVSRAATRVYISQPALSRQLLLLESELGVPLLERKARGVVLTEAGELLKQRAIAVMKDVASMKEVVSAQGLEPVGTVTMGIPSALRHLLTTRVAARFTHQFPKALLRIREGTSRDIRDGVASGETDIALFSTEEPSNPFECTPILTEKLVAIALPEVRLSMAHSMSVRALCRNPLILTSYPNSLRTIVDRAAAAAGAEVKVSVEVDMSALMLDLVRQGLGYAILPYCAVHVPLQANHVSACPVKDLQISWIAAYSRERSLSTAAQHLLRVLCAEARQMVITNQWPTASLPA